MHRDDIIIRDIGAHALLSIQHNLVAGTLAPFAKESRKIQGLLDDVLKFKVSAGFMLTEIGHGLDAKNLETEVRLQSDGSFVLHTPRLEASKFVPPSMPVAGIPRIAVVMAKLMVHGEDFGLRPVVVALSDGKQMCKGVTSRLLPYMSGIQAPYAITSFDNVALSSTAVLGSLERPTSMRDNFFHQIARIAPGTLAMSMIMIPALKIVTYITGRYSLRRTVGVANKERIPIICFRAQQIPILHALAQLAVMTPFANKCIEWFKDTSFKPQVRQGFAVILKAVFIQMAQRSIPEMVERCGAQGLFQHNQICDADYEAGLAQEAWDIVSSIPAKHHSQEFNRIFIPQCKPLVLGIGHRMVYETALAAGVDSDLLALYEAGAVKENLDWYTEKGLLTRQRFRDMENRALDSIEPRLDELLDELKMEPYVTAPITQQGLFNDFVQGLPTFTGAAEYSVL
ncbi:hypothetical protein H9Q72_001064 [Fusarium xylarioides]|uniref:Acyl-CoA oxidase n=1 Tax=Fusarium xylarioides TaxID=221167 RepID=A0A9P7I226_9HYPO|nr:hypothetical protein H9Q72_001064 [Fusarium xylarioides]